VFIVTGAAGGITSPSSPTSGRERRHLLPLDRAARAEADDPRIQMLRPDREASARAHRGARPRREATPPQIDSRSCIERERRPCRRSRASSGVAPPISLRETSSMSGPSGPSSRRFKGHGESMPSYTRRDRDQPRLRTGAAEYDLVFDIRRTASSACSRLRVSDRGTVVSARSQAASAQRADRLLRRQRPALLL